MNLHFVYISIKSPALHVFKLFQTEQYKKNICNTTSCEYKVMNFTTKMIVVHFHFLR